MIQTERQYLVTFREARRFEHAARRVRKEADHRKAALDPADYEQLELAEVQHKALLSVLGDLKADLAKYEAAHDADRRGCWMPTYSGKRFWIQDPRPQDIVAEDIAQGLSRISRYNGATLGKRGITVAQHCVMASRIVSEEYALYALMHDAAEAYTGDVISPLKKLLGNVFKAIEHDIMWAVADAFGFDLSRGEGEQEVKRADNVLLATEVRDLVPCHFLLEEPEEEPLPDPLVPWSQRKSKQEFLRRLQELTRGRSQKR